ATNVGTPACEAAAPAPLRAPRRALRARGDGARAARRRRAHLEDDRRARRPTLPGTSRPPRSLDATHALAGRPGRRADRDREHDALPPRASVLLVQPRRR